MRTIAHKKNQPVTSVLLRLLESKVSVCPMAKHVFSLQYEDGDARAGVLVTPHAVIETPIFMPVGTVGSVKALAPDDLKASGAPIILGNTYHLYLRPGDRLVANFGGLHKFSSWPGAILTDSGGFQVFSLGNLRKICAAGVEFKSHIDGSRHFFTPEKVLDIQRNLGSDIMMVLDECVSFGASYDYTEKSVELTGRWAKTSIEKFRQSECENLLFGITQGGFFRDLRERSIEEICSLDFDGYAIGGLSVGESKQEMHYFIDYVARRLPAMKPRYLMGVGTPLDIVRGIKAGVDMFDCVLPTRNARNGTLYTSCGKVNIKRREFASSDAPLDPKCSCYTCRTFSLAYLRHLFTSHELLSFRLNSLHNITYFLGLVRKAREAIRHGNYASFVREIEAIYPGETI